MKLHALCASAVALTLAFTSPASAITRQDRDFALLATVSWAVVAVCPGYEMVEGSPRLVADRNGADFDAVGPAVAAAFMAQVNQPYERDHLISEITVVVRATLMEMNDDIGKGKARACAKWGESILPAGMIRRK
jgi:hypothetical protein